MRHASVPWSVRSLLALFVAAVIAGCGGGTGEQSQMAHDGRARTLAVAPLSEVVVERLVLKAERRITRTVFEYEFAIVVRNAGNTSSGVVAQLTRVGPGTTIVDGSVDVGDLTPNMTVTPTDTIRLRHDRSSPFDSGALIWSISGTAHKQLSVVAEMKPDVLRINDPTGSLVTFPDAVSVNIAPQVAVQPGRVAIHNGRAFRLGALLSTDPSGNRRFSLEHPALGDLFTKLEIDGTANVVVSTTNGSQKRRLAWLPDDLSCVISNAIAGDYLGARCDFAMNDSEYEATKIKGSLEAGYKVTADKYDFVSNTGSAKIDIAVAGRAAIELSKTLVGVGTMSAEAEDEVCSTALRGGNSRARLLLVAPAIPLGASGASLQLPICLAAGAKVNVAGEVLSLAPQLSFSVLLGGGKPRLVPGISSQGGAEPGRSASPFSLDPSNTGAAAFKLEGSGEVAVELSTEVGAFGLAYAGLAGRVKGSANVEGKIAPAMVGVSSTLGALRASPQVCGKIDLGASFELESFAQGSWVFAGAGVRSSILDLQLGDRREDRIGICGKSSAKVSASASETFIAKGETFKIRAAVTPAPANDEIDYDDKPTGSLIVRLQSTGAELCRIAELPGSPQSETECLVALSTDGQHVIEVAYDGDSKYKASVSAPVVVHVGNESSARYSGSSTFVGPQSHTRAPCWAGTFSLIGNSTFTIDGTNYAYQFDGLSRSQSQCFNGESPHYSPPMTFVRDGNRFVGRYYGAYTGRPECPYVCYISWDVVVELVDQGRRAVGTVRHYHYYSAPPLPMAEQVIVWAAEGPLDLQIQSVTSQRLASAPVRLP